MNVKFHKLTTQFINSLVFLFALIHAEKNNQDTVKYCEIYQEDSSNQCYAKEVLISMAHSPHQLAFERDMNTLYFSFDSGQGEYIPALLKLDTKELTVLKGIKDAFAIAYDPINREIFFGGTHGIYRFNSKAKSLKRLNLTNLDIWWLFVKKAIYFIKFPSLNTYSYFNSTIKTYPELSDNVIHQMVIDRDENKIFTNSSGIYGIKPNGTTASLLRDSPRFLNMAIDNYGNVYVCSDDGIYTVSKIVQKVKRILNIHGVLGFTFDQSNNIIYSDSHEIVRLVPLDKTN